MSVTSMPHSLPFLSGEVLEKATRVLTDEEEALLDKYFVGRTVNVGNSKSMQLRVLICTCALNILHVAYHGSSKTDEILPI